MLASRSSWAARSSRWMQVWSRPREKQDPSCNVQHPKSRAFSTITIKCALCRPTAHPTRPTPCRAKRNLRNPWMRKRPERRRLSRQTPTSLSMAFGTCRLVTRFLLWFKFSRKEKVATQSPFGPRNRNCTLRYRYPPTSTKASIAEISCLSRKW
jgi:hypothetical protein